MKASSNVKGLPMDIRERWSPIPGWEGFYEVSSQGRILSVPRKHQPRFRILRPVINTGGYPQVCLCRLGTQSYRPVHLLVASAFLGPRPEGMQVCHVDGDHLNPRADNLRYGTPSENVLDQVRHGRHHWASRTHCLRGHPYDESNTWRIVRGDGSEVRRCATCHRQQMRDARARKRALAAQ